MGILALCEAGDLELISSDALDYEMGQNPWMERREHTRAVLLNAAFHAEIVLQIAIRAKQWNAFGIKLLKVLSPTELIGELGR